MTLLEQELTAAAEGLAIYLAAGSSIGIVLLDPEMAIRDCNEGFLQLFCFAEKPLGQAITTFLPLSRVALEDPRCRHHLHYVRESGAHGVCQCHCLTVSNGYLLFCERLLLTESRVIEQIGAINNELVALQREEAKKNRLLEKMKAELAARITDMERVEQQLVKLSQSDELTGLTNRRGFMLLAAQQIKVADRTGLGFSLVYADLDGLKGINDTFGHNIGDQALRDTADVLRRSFRSSDIMARIGGDEFAILCMATPGPLQERAGHLLQANIAAHNLSALRSYRLSISFGVTSYDPADACSLEELLKRGDRLMYQHKKKKFGMEV